MLIPFWNWFYTVHSPLISEGLQSGWTEINSADELNEVMELLLINYLLALTSNVSSWLDYKQSLGGFIFSAVGGLSSWWAEPHGSVCRAAAAVRGDLAGVLAGCWFSGGFVPLCAELLPLGSLLVLPLWQWSTELFLQFSAIPVGLFSFLPLWGAQCLRAVSTCPWPGSVQVWPPDSQGAFGLFLNPLPTFLIFPGLFFFLNKHVILQSVRCFLCFTHFHLLN